MKTTNVFKITTLVIATLLLAGCAGPAEPTRDPLILQLATQLAKLQEVETVEPELEPTEAPVSEPTSTPMPSDSGGEAAAAPGECPLASELGPWAPNNGLGEDYEVTANETNSAGVHIQLWWPGGSGEEWGKQEISVFLPSGLSVEVQDGAGRGWEYALTCDMAEIQAQMEADHSRRETDTSYFGVVDIDDLIETGLVVVRFDRR